MSYLTVSGLVGPPDTPGFSQYVPFNRLTVEGYGTEKQAASVFDCTVNTLVGSVHSSWSGHNKRNIKNEPALSF